MITFRIDRRSGVPAYLQVVAQTVESVRLGHLRPGDRLPTVREVVLATGMNPNTVSKAYRELERSGIAEGRRGVGTFIRSSTAVSPGQGVLDLRARLVEWTRDALESGISAVDIMMMASAIPMEVIDEVEGNSP